MTDKKNKGGAPKGNTNRQKGDAPATANLSCRCSASLRRKVEAAAKAKGVTLTDWLVTAVEAAVVS